MSSEATANEARMFEELQELVALEVKDILATATKEGFEPRDVVSALELALQAEIQALEDGAPLEDSVAAGIPDG